MSSESDKDLRNSILTEEGKLRHENSYLKERLSNLEAFKKNFFILQNDLIEAKEKLATYEEALNFCQLKDRIIQSHETPIDTAETAKNDQVINFLHDSISANSYQDLVMSIFQSTEGFDLGIGIQIHHKNILNFALDEAEKNRNTQIINQYKEDGKKVLKDDFIVINEKYITLVANNLPTQSEAMCKQIIDFLEIITLGANTRIDTINQKNDLDELKTNIYNIFKKTNNSFASIQDNMDNQVITISELFLSFEKNLLATILRANISPAHIDLIKLIVHDAKIELNLILTSSLAIDENFMEVMRKLEKAYLPKNL